MGTLAILASVTLMHESPQISTKTIPLASLESVVSTALQRHGASEFAADEVAKALGRAEQLGNSSCGLRHVALDCAQLSSGRVVGHATPTLQRPKLGLVHVDANFGFAQPAFAVGLPKALRCVESLGVAVLAISRAYTCAALGYFPERIAQHGYIAIAFTNASASVTAPGGAKPLLGTNPIAMSVPNGKGGIAFQFDQCTSAANLRLVREAAKQLQAIPEGWAVARDGSPTVDPHEALAGALLSAGGIKGFSFGLMAEVLASFFTGSAMSLDTTNLAATEGSPHGLGMVCLLLDPTAMAGHRFVESVERLEAAIRNQPGTRLPGTRRSAGMEATVDAALWNEVCALAGISDPCMPRMDRA
jgi:(2R)-3-sulfolactate dehydrogenase (NADP+)